MFKALELNGFKSFADRTRFEFPAGITSVVGPNGSGKSNIVDAIKWVLGSQSAKALRGKEMTDVIFSGSRSRRQTGSAEVTLIFDNSTGILDFDSDEVHITRRVYRSGEGEYLINRQQVRLRDIRDVFAGTGVSTGAYSIIEQGKVDALLQSSPRERRLIFEEAAGVSRFKLKRQEAARRLERVEQNLLRLSDIVDELDSRLRSVRSQAGKARKYKEQSDRLKQLRIQVALSDWRDLSRQFQELQAEAAETIRCSEQMQQQVATSEQQLSAAESETDRLQDKLNETSDQAATVRERIAQCESTRRSQLARCDELEQESERLQRQLLAMTSRAGNAEQLVTETSVALETAEAQYDELYGEVQSQQAQFDLTQKSLAQGRKNLDAWRKEHSTVLHAATQLEHKIHVLESERSRSIAATDRYRQQLEHAETNRLELNKQLAQVQSNLQSSEAEAQEADLRLTEVQDNLLKNRQTLATSQSHLADLRGRLSGAKERAIVLEELELRLDGLSAGTKEALRLSQEEPGGPFGCVRGVVADLLNVDADTAALVETALGERANHLLIEKADPSFFTMTESDWAGRTSFLRLDVPLPASAVDRIDLSHEPGVMGRADQFVETTPDLAILSRRLLGRWWFVDSLHTAMRLAGGVGRGLNYVTVVGEVVAADGTFIVGPRQSTTGLLSRRSELRALVDEINEMESEAKQQEASCANLEAAIFENEEVRQRLAANHKQQTAMLAKVQLQFAAMRERADQANRQHTTAAAEFSAADKDATVAGTDLVQHRQELAAHQANLEKLNTSIHQWSEKGKQLEEQLASLQTTVTDHRVALARGEQRRDGLRGQMEQLERDHKEHDRALADTRHRDAQCHEQQESLKQSVLDFGSELSELYRTKETFATDSQALSQQHGELRKRRSELLRDAERLREQLLKGQSAQQQAELRLQQLQHARSDLATRMSDDYDLNLTVLATTETLVEFGPREEVDREIGSLRQIIQSIGPVNVEALSELEAVEDRHSTLSQQYEDLRKAKLQLEQLVSQINIESRDLFVKSLDVIRGHFQELYGNLFGGGEADIIIDDSEIEDVLECGIEIIARPPGKQPRSISLLSGGERTLTCVALLLAIFRSRPSPFCVLDEVDAALDEANIVRFVEVLKEFMSSTQFIVVTHSKRTMSCADTIYGITMQESGISKQVSVRFEDVSADGNIGQTAADSGAKAA